jgi:very-short-patch-repair endonuclease
MSTWREQFVRSVVASPDHPGFLDDYVERAFRDRENPRDVDALVSEAFVVIGAQAMWTVFAELEEALNTCESPIEQAVFLALTIAGREHFTTVSYVTPAGRSGGDMLAPDILTIEPQAQLGDYRVDFLLTAEHGDPSRALKAQMVVECDGHDFHERTKEQARRDRNMDRTLQSLGFECYRYTGREIWNDVYGRASEAVDALQVILFEREFGHRPRGAPKLEEA